MPKQPKIKIKTAKASENKYPPPTVGQILDDMGHVDWCITELVDGGCIACVWWNGARFGNPHFIPYSTLCGFRVPRQMKVTMTPEVK